MWRESSGDRMGWYGERTDYDEGEDARGSLLGHLDGRLKGELSSTGIEECVFCAHEIGYNISIISRRHATSSLQQSSMLQERDSLDEGSRE